MATLTKRSANKAAETKPSPKKAERKIKYEDKSAGQPQLLTIFNQLRQILMAFAKDHIILQEDSGGQLHLNTNKPIVVTGKKREAVCFASLLVQKGYVGFYFMPIYTDVYLKKALNPALLKLPKGKACFHIKTLDENLAMQVQKALQAGCDCYKAKGWA